MMKINTIAIGETWPQFPTEIPDDEVETLSCLKWSELYELAKKNFVPYLFVTVAIVKQNKKYYYFKYDGTLFLKYSTGQTDKVIDPSSRLEIVKTVHLFLRCFDNNFMESSIENEKLNPFNSLFPHSPNLNLERKSLASTLFFQSLNPFAREDISVRPTLAKCQWLLAYFFKYEKLSNGLNWIWCAANNGHKEALIAMESQKNYKKLKPCCTTAFIEKELP